MLTVKVKHELLRNAKQLYYHQHPICVKGETIAFQSAISYQEEQVTFLVFLLIAIIVGNLIVLVAVVISHRKTRMTFFILHLAIAVI
ncbi:hypothetical protein KUTeg_001635 [Tegillarca granosa]|uniref:G-protein coupled receptors family 1 profile domain-containing protein n=1 Tax=Tegillarca granosa TaxID=220873 RepID=A0ABQ9FS09_TEGGR|nr:hypothetical protein KUTeg_001635 [Tegillarca granosa]